MEFGVVAMYFPARRAGLIQTSSADAVFFWSKDARNLKLERNRNEIVFSTPRKLVPGVGQLVVFERHRRYSAVPGVVQARAWSSYSMWLVVHGLQVMQLKALARRSPQRPVERRKQQAGLF
jgi:hypothetical protein